MQGNKPVMKNLQVEECSPRCEYGHACLSDPSHRICEIERTVSAEIDFVQELKHQCPYYASLGEGIICYCPVRHELHQRFGI
jgi:hypothetical protein